MRPWAALGAPRNVHSAADVAVPSMLHDAVGWQRTRAAAAVVVAAFEDRNPLLLLLHSTAGAEVVVVVATWNAAAAADYCWAVEAALCQHQARTVASQIAGMVDAAADAADAAAAAGMPSWRPADVDS